MATSVPGKGRSEFYDPTAVDVSRSDYEEEFKPSAFLRYYRAENPAEISPFVRHKLQCLHESFQSVPEGARIVDFGAGPVIVSAISAATKASDIVLAAYTENNRKFLRQWLDGEAEAFDWSVHFAYVVQELEGKGEKEILKRQDQVRKLVKNVVHCDITQDPPIEGGFDGLYDVLMCSLVLEGTATTKDEYVSHVSRLARLIKPGGSIFYYGAGDKTGYYNVGDSNFPSFYVSEELVLKAFRNAGFCDVVVNPGPDAGPDKSFRFISGTRL